LHSMLGNNMDVAGRDFVPPTEGMPHSHLNLLKDFLL